MHACKDLLAETSPPVGRQGFCSKTRDSVSLKPILRCRNTATHVMHELFRVISSNQAFILKRQNDGRRSKYRQNTKRCKTSVIE